MNLIMKKSISKLVMHPSFRATGHPRLTAQKHFLDPGDSCWDVAATSYKFQKIGTQRIVT